MEEIVKLIHLSDLHFDSTIEEPENSIINSIYDSLIEKLEGEIDNKGEEEIYIVVTGDIVKNGEREKDFQKAQIFFKKLLKRLKIPNNNLVISCGNHDKSFEILFNDSGLKELIKKNFENDFLTDKEKTLITEKFITKSKNDLEIYNVSFFSKFNKFCKTLNVSKPKNTWINVDVYTHGIHNKKNVIFACYNSAYNSLSGKVDYGNLFFHKETTQEILRILRNFGKNENKKTVLTLFHHNPSWFNRNMNYSNVNNISLMEEIFSLSDIFLSGHIHNPRSALPDYLFGKVPAIYGGSVFTKDEDVRGYFAANIIKIIPTEFCFELKCLQYEKRTADSNEKKNWELVFKEKKWPFFKTNVSEVILEKVEQIKREKAVEDLELEISYLKEQLFKKKSL